MRDCVQQRLHSVRGADPEHGGIVLGWLTRLVVILGVAGVFLFDAISLGTTSMSLADQGSLAARDASEVWQRTGDVQQAYNAAVKSALDSNPHNLVQNTTFRIDGDNTVHLTVSREATTLLFYRWSKTAEWTQIERETKGRSVG